MIFPFRIITVNITFSLFQYTQKGFQKALKMQILKNKICMDFKFLLYPNKCGMNRVPAEAEWRRHPLENSTYLSNREARIDCQVGDEAWEKSGGDIAGALCKVCAEHAARQ